MNTLEEQVENMFQVLADSYKGRDRKIFDILMGSLDNDHISETIKQLSQLVDSELSLARREGEKAGIKKMYHEINDGILDESTYTPREGRHGLEDSWWAGVDDMQDVVCKKLDMVRKKYKEILKESHPESEVVDPKNV